MKVAEKVVDKNNKKVKEQTHKPYMILVVEDDKDLSRLIRKKLAQEGFLTESALSGAEAITWLAQNPNTLLLLDYQLSDMTGEQVIKSLADRKCSVPFIIVTGHGDEKLAVRMMKLGARNYLVKEKGFLDLLPSIVNQVMHELETEKKLSEAEEALKRSEQKYRLLIDNMHDAILVVDKQGIVKFGNSATESILGRCKDELLGEMFGFGVSGDEATEIEHIHSDGRLVTGEMRMVESEWEGEPAFIVSIRDISKRKQTEVRLQESEERFRGLYTKTPAMLHSIDTNGRLVEVSDRWLTVLGYERGEVVGRKSVEFLTEESSHYAQTVAMPKFMKAGYIDSVPYQFVKKSGEIIDIELSAITVRDKEGNFVQSLAVLTDVTEHKSAQEEINMLASAVCSIRESVSITDLTDDIIFVNEAFLKTYGYERSELIGKSISIVGSPNNPPDMVRESRQETLHGGWQGELLNRRKDGSEFPIFLSTSVIVDEKGQAIALVGIAEDMTERQILESQLRQAQKLESIGQLAAGIAHEINTPIQYVGDNTRFLQDAFNDIGKLLTKYEQVIEVNKTGSVNNELIKEVEIVSKEVDLDYLLEEIPTAIEQSQEGTERVASIVRAMKEFSHPGAEEKTLIDINKALGSTITVAQNEWKYVAEMETDFDPSLPLVRCLPGELNQVFLNIIINAAHAIAGAVDESSGEKGTITVSTCHENEWVEIRISDTAAGIPEEARPRIFDPFFTTKEVGKGTGQGLAISYAVVVEKHGGSITFETEMGKGTTFVIHLPLGSSN